MPVIIPVDYVQCNLVFGLNGDSEPMVCTFGLHLADEASATPALADAIMNEWAIAWSSGINLDYSIDEVVLYGFNGLGPSEVTVSTLAPIQMTGTQTPLPQNCAILVRKRTDLAGRRGRGRMYVPGLSEAAVSPTGVIESEWLAGLQTRADNFLEALQLTVGINDMVILHRSEGAGTEPAPTPVLSLVVDERIATQRQRLRR